MVKHFCFAQNQNRVAERIQRSIAPNAESKQDFQVLLRRDRTKKRPAVVIAKAGNSFVSAPNESLALQLLGQRGISDQGSVAMKSIKSLRSYPLAALADKEFTAISFVSLKISRTIPKPSVCNHGMGLMGWTISQPD